MLGVLCREWLSWIYPFTCELCGRGGLDHMYLCPDCRGHLVRIEPPMCAICGEPAEGSVIPSGLCLRCAAETPSFAEAHAPYVNEGELRELILAFKYAGARYLAGTFARMMAEALREHAHWFSSRDFLLVPVPMDRKKLVSRGYNQAEELALLLGREIETPCIQLLKRRQDKTPQASLSREQRLRHVRKLYSVDARKIRRHDIQGRHLLLVDDVLTTGATANACARLLLRAGASAVSVLTLARTHHAWHG